VRIQANTDDLQSSSRRIAFALMAVNVTSISVH